MSMLLNYGIKIHEIDYEELDVLDKVEAQDQINRVRREYAKLIKLSGNIQEMLLDANKELNVLTKAIIEEAGGARSNTIFSSNSEYIEIEARISAYKTGLRMTEDQIDFYKGDLRILNSVLYNRF